MSDTIIRLHPDTPSDSPSKIELDHLIIRFAGDSGDGMQITGTQFTNTSALVGNDIATFPDFPAEIRAPAGTLAGVSGFQVHIGNVNIHTPGDEPDVLIAMNPAALKVNLPQLKANGLVVVNEDSFDERNLKLAGYATNPLDDQTLDGYQVVKATITKLTQLALDEFEMDSLSKRRCKNFFALGMVYWMYNRPLSYTEKWIREQFKKKPILIDANLKALQSGYNFGNTLEAFASTYEIKAAPIEPGTYRAITGNQATAWGLIAAKERSGLPLFYGTYPITPASDVLHELSKHKQFGVITFQAEDEIAAIASAIGSSFGGGLAVTASSGPGISLKAEAMGLAIKTELPLVILNVQRAGPSTGMPTKTEQADLLQAIYGRHGESPLCVVAAATPADCFNMVFEAARIALTHMTPVIFLSDGYIANGSEPWKIPASDDLPEIVAPFAKQRDGWMPFKRDEARLRREWAIPGMEGFEHRIGGIESQWETGNISYVPENHERMSHVRQAKIDRIADFIPEQEVFGAHSGDLAVLSWGGTYGAVYSAVDAAQKEGLSVSHIHLRYLNPFPKNLEALLKNFNKVMVAELNMGQLSRLIRDRFQIETMDLHKIQGQPFKIREVKAKITEIIKGMV